MRTNSRLLGKFAFPSESCICLFMNTVKNLNNLLKFSCSSDELQSSHFPGYVCIIQVDDSTCITRGQEFHLGFNGHSAVAEARMFRIVCLLIRGLECARPH